MFPLLLESFSSHLAGNCTVICDTRYYKTCKKSLFFALKSFKIRFIFCSVFASKPMQKLNISLNFRDFLRNILQVNILRAVQGECFGLEKYGKTGCNSLTCKILTEENKKSEEKAQKSTYFFTRFLH